MARNILNGPDSENESISISVEKIDNGYITTESRWDGKNYESNRVFSEVKPKLGTSTAKPVAKSNSMARAVAVLNKGRSK